MKGTTIATFSFYVHIMRQQTAGQTMVLRPDCNGCIEIISIEESSWIYVTNIEDFNKDFKDYEIKQGDYWSCKGMKFDTSIDHGLFFDSHTYIKGSMRDGGFDKY